MKNLILLIACMSGVNLIISCSLINDGAYKHRPSRAVSAPHQSKSEEILVACQTTQATTITDSNEFLGSLEAKTQSTIISDNEGTIKQILVEPGTKVTAGTSLLLLDTGRDIKAPISGIVSDILVNEGEFIQKGKELTKIFDIQTLNVNIGVPTEYSSQLKIGLPVEIISSQRENSLVGKIKFISPEVNQNSILVKATVNNNGSLRDNQPVVAKIIWNKQVCTLVPTTSVSRIAGQNFVFVAEQKKENGKTALIAKQKVIQLGNIQGNLYEVISGLDSGEKLIVSELLNLTDGTSVKCIDKSNKDSKK